MLSSILVKFAINKSIIFSEDANENMKTGKLATALSSIGLVVSYYIKCHQEGPTLWFWGT